MATWVPTVRQIVNGQPVEASTDNGPLQDLTSRTDWLKQQIDSLLGGSQLILRGQPVQVGTALGSTVYLASDNVFKPALAQIVAGSNGSYQAANPTFWQGVVGAVSGATADIVIGGTLTLTPVQWAPVFESGVFAVGEVYLSENEATPGRLTTNPGTLAVYVGRMRPNGQLLVRLGAFGAYLNHVHLERELLGNPAGTVIDPVNPNPQIINTPNPAVRGWLPANATYFPGFTVGVQIPTGAKFGYNIQHPAETALRQVFPVTPPGNAQFAQSGLILTTAQVVVNNFGIWWMENGYGEAPWPVDYAATLVAQPIDLWTTRITAAASLSEVIRDQVIAYLAAGEINNLAVAALIPFNQADLELTSTIGNLTSGFKGNVTVRNRGVTALKVSRGLAVTAATLGGDNTTGFKGVVTLNSSIQVPVPHLFTRRTTVGPTLAPLTTNGVPVGTDATVYGHVLADTPATDFIDFAVHFGDDLLPTPQQYQVLTRMSFAVDMPAGTVLIRNFDVRYYVFGPGDALSSTNLKQTSTLQAATNSPGQIQVAQDGPYVPLFVERYDTLLVRVVANTGLSALPVNTLRVVGVSVGLVPV